MTKRYYWMKIKPVEYNFHFDIYWNRTITMLSVYKIVEIEYS